MKKPLKTLTKVFKLGGIVIENDLTEIINSIIQRRNKIERGGRLSLQLKLIKDNLQEINVRTHLYRHLIDFIERKPINIINVYPETLKAKYGETLFNSLSENNCEFIQEKMRQKLSIYFDKALDETINELNK